MKFNYVIYYIKQSNDAVRMWNELNPFHSAAILLNFVRKKQKGFCCRLDVLSCSANGTKKSDKNQTVVNAWILFETVNTFNETRIEMRQKASLPNASLLSPTEPLRHRINESNFVKRVSLSASNNCHWKAKKIIISWVLIRNYELFPLPDSGNPFCGIFVSFPSSVFMLLIFCAACVIASSVIKLCTVRNMKWRLFLI